MFASIVLLCFLSTSQAASISQERLERETIENDNLDENIDPNVITDSVNTEDLEEVNEDYANSDENNEEYSDVKDENLGQDENADELYIDERNQKISEGEQETVTLDAFVHAVLNKESQTFYLNLIMKYNKKA